MAEQQKKMSVMQLTFIVTVNMMGSGIIMLPANMAQVGAISLLSWVVTALGSMAIAYGFAQAGIFNQRTGGLAAYAEDAYGKDGYFQVFFLYFLSLAIANVAVASSALGYLAAFFPGLTATPVDQLHRRDRAAVAHHGGELRRPQRDRQDRRGHGVGRDPSGRVHLDRRLVLVQRRDLLGRLEPEGHEHARGHGFEHLADAVGLPRHGVGLAERLGGGEPEARRAAGLHVRHARRGRRLHPVDDGDPGHRAECRAGRVDRAVRPGLREDVQPDGGLDRHGAGGDGLRRLAARLAVHARADRQGCRRHAHVPGHLRQGQRSRARRSWAW